MINICRFFKHKCFEKEYREAVEECEALRLENKELYRILADLKEERKLKDKYKQECEQKHEIIEELIRERQELQKQLRHQLDMNIAINKEREELKEQLEFVRTHRTVIDAEKDCYCKALEEIEKVINNILNSCLGRNTVGCKPAHNVCGDLIKMLDIVGKAREYKND